MGAGLAARLVGLPDTFIDNSAPLYPGLTRWWNVPTIEGAPMDYGFINVPFYTPFPYGIPVEDP